MGRSNRYIILFAAAVCLVCSVFVAFAAVTLKERQDANVVLDRQTKVLAVDYYGMYDLLSNTPLAERMQKYYEGVGVPAFTAEEQAFAKELKASIQDLYDLFPVQSITTWIIW